MNKAFSFLTLIVASFYKVKIDTLKAASWKLFYCSYLDFTWFVY